MGPLELTTFLDLWQAKTFTIAAAVKAGSASQARIFLQSDAALAAADYSDYHTGGGAWEILTKTVTTEAAADRLIFGIESTSAGNVDVDACVVVIGDLAPQRFVPAEVVFNDNELALDVVFGNGQDAGRYLAGMQRR